MKNMIIDATKQAIDEMETTLRPQFLKDYTGQEEIKEMLHVYITTSNMREEALDHCLLYGPPGLGKTTLAHIIANEKHVNIKTTSGPALTRIGDLVAILSTLEPGDVLFIDEIHRIPKVIEEVLYSAMEDYTIDLFNGVNDGPEAFKFTVVPFTLVGATTRFGDLTAPLRDRFGIVNQLHYYNVEELRKIIKRTSQIFNYPINDDAIVELAKRSRGTPRIANRLFRRIRDFAQFSGSDVITLDITTNALDKLNIDKSGLDISDRNYLNCLIDRFHGGPAGLEAIAATLNEESVTLEDVNEPYLLQEGYIIRTPRGRVASEKAYLHLGKKMGGLV